MYKEKLEEMYKEALESPFIPPQNKIVFLSEYIFDFTTYDSSISEMFAKSMLEVIDAIYNRKNFEYIADEKNYINYLTMINMPFLANKINWWTSIRWAWFETGSEDCKITFEWIIKRDEIANFMKELLEWSEFTSSSPDLITL